MKISLKLLSFFVLLMFQLVLIFGLSFLLINIGFDKIGYHPLDNSNNSIFVALILSFMISMAYGLYMIYTNVYIKNKSNVVPNK